MKGRRTERRSIGTVLHPTANGVWSEAPIYWAAGWVSLGSDIFVHFFCYLGFIDSLNPPLQRSGGFYKSFHAVISSRAHVRRRLLLDADTYPKMY